MNWNQGEYLVGELILSEEEVSKSSTTLKTTTVFKNQELMP